MAICIKTLGGSSRVGLDRSNTLRGWAAVLVGLAGIWGWHGVQAQSGAAQTTPPCVPAHPLHTVTPGTLTVSTVYYPPMNEIDAAGQYVGMEADVLRYFAERECLTLRPEVGTFAAATQFIATGRADISAGQWYRTEVRAQTMGLSAPVFVDLLAIASKAGYDTLKSLEGKRVGSVQGYYWTKNLQNVFGSSLKLYPTPVAALQDLRNGRLDAVLDAYAVTNYAQQQGQLDGIQIVVAARDERVNATVEPAQSGFLYQRENTELGAALDAIIADMHAKGLIADIVKKHKAPASMADVGAPRYVATE